MGLRQLRGTALLIPATMDGGSRPRAGPPSAPPPHSRPRMRASALLLLAGAALAAPPAAAADAPGDAALRAAVQALDAKNFQDKAAAVAALGALGDPRALPALAALARGGLYARSSDGAVVLAARAGGAYALTDPVGGAELPAAAKQELRKIRANNRLRGLIRGAAGLLGLRAPEPAARRAAVERILKQPFPAALAPLRRARDRETDPAVRARLETGIAALELDAPDPALRRAAAAALGAEPDAALRPLLERRRAVEADPAVRAALAAALEAAEQRRWLLGIAENLSFGISLGSVLLLAAIGLAITFGVMGVINMAHGEMIMLGAYATFVVQELFRAVAAPELFGFYLLAAAPAAFLTAAAVGLLLERGCIRFLYGRPLETLLATWGVSLILQQLVRSLFGANNREVANPEWLAGAAQLFGGVSVTVNRLCIVGFCLAVVAALAAFIRYSRFGLNMRAVTQNRAMAASMGIRTGRVDALTFALGSGIAGLAGMALSQISNVSPNLGQNFIVDSFLVVVFGGVGSLWGTIVGAFTLGIVNKFLEPVSGAILGKIVVLVLIILFIQLRPRGLFALKGRAGEAGP